MAFGNGKDVYVIASQCLAKGRPLTDVSEMGVTFYLIHQIFKVGVGVGIAVCKIDIIVRIGKGKVPT